MKDVPAEQRAEYVQNVATKLAADAKSIAEDLAAVLQLVRDADTLMTTGDSKQAVLKLVEAANLEYDVLGSCEAVGALLELLDIDEDSLDLEE